LVLGNPSAGPAVFGAPIELDLGGRGIREIAKNASDEYVISAGPADQAGPPPKDFRFYTWNGNPASSPVLRNAGLGTLTVEAIVEVPNGLNSSSTIQVVSDDGDDSLQHGTAQGSQQNNFKKFRSDIITWPSFAYGLNGIIWSNRDGGGQSA
jgi:hypothetical protein